MESQVKNQSGKILIAYYSKTGNTRAAAEYIHQSVGGDLFEIKPARDYPREYRATTEIARQEKGANARPELAANVNNMAQYDTIFLGYPNWWSTMPMFFFTFLESHDLKGKTIIPFCTNGGGGLGQSVADIKSLCPGSKILDALAIRSGNEKKSENAISVWLRDIFDLLSKN